MVNVGECRPGEAPGSCTGEVDASQLSGESCEEVTVKIGPASGTHDGPATKTVSADVTRCPEVVNKHNWLSHRKVRDEFRIEVEGGKVTAIRQDKGRETHNWGQDLAFKCEKCT